MLLKSTCLKPETKSWLNKMSTFQNYISNRKKLVLTMRAASGVRVPSLGGGCLGKERPAPGDSLCCGRPRDPPSGVLGLCGSSRSPRRPGGTWGPCGAGIRAGATGGRPRAPGSPWPRPVGTLGIPGRGGGSQRARDRLHLLRVHEAVSRGQPFKVPLN